MGNKKFIYKFLDKDGNVLYVGKTHSLEERITNHILYGHLPLECYQELTDIMYLELTVAEADLLEIYYINTYKPKYNKLDVTDTLELVLKTSKRWLRFDSSKYKDLLQLKLQTKHLQQDLHDIKLEYDKLIQIANILDLNKSVNQSYCMKHKAAKIAYINKTLKTRISTCKNSVNTFDYADIITMYKKGLTYLKFESKNLGSHIIVYIEGNKAIFEDTSHTLSEVKFNKYIVDINNSKSNKGSYNIAGLIPYLDYIILTTQKNSERN